MFVNAMIPKPGETAGAWWDATGAVEAREEAAVRYGYAKEFDEETYFLHDVPQDVLHAGPERQREQAATVFGEPCRFKGWPNILIHVLAGRDDRFFPIDFQRRSPVKGWARRWIIFKAAIWWLCRMRKDWPSVLLRTCVLFSSIGHLVSERLPIVCRSPILVALCGSRISMTWHLGDGSHTGKINAQDPPVPLADEYEADAQKARNAPRTIR